MDKRTTLLLWLTILVLFFSVSMAFYKYVIAENYLISMEIECDPVFESCFVFAEENTGELFYYKLLEKRANNFSDCGQDEEVCGPLFCGDAEKGCRITLCSEEASDVDDFCSKSSNE